MKKSIIRSMAMATLCTFFLFQLPAQERNSLPRKEKATEKKEKSEKMTIIIDGDNVTINGKPVTEYDGDNIIIRKKNLERAFAPFAYSAPKVRVAPRGYPAPHEFNFEFTEPAIASVKPRAQLGVLTESHEKGVKITEVVKESAAAKAGLTEGDIITTVGGQKVEDPDELADIIQDKKPGEETEIAYIRGKKSQKVSVKLGETKVRTTVRSAGRPGNDFYFNDAFDFAPRAFNRAEGFGIQRGGDVFISRAPRLGLRIEDTEEDKGARVLYVEEGSYAEKAGIKKDDIINSIDSSTVKNTEDARRALAMLGGKQNFAIGIQRAGGPVNVEVKIPKELRKTDL
jgi:serine protease Do